ncbi:MAG: methylated-DNA--[protein]-cysteine S-methyltransferase [Candidatus Gastranaerophilales bacterium]|nr:methylated-DNA--[protein]-cysteine S-methyltransferase [Candidatus Gastranaerophilales bacterium]
MIYTFKYISKIGELYITADENYLLSLKFSSGYKEPDNMNNFIINETIKQLNEYFNLERKIFKLPLKLIGTDFQKQIWNQLNKIPYGETITYKELAALAGNSKALRAAGNACNKNPIAIIIPCHRVLGINKNLTGYAGGLDKKEFLLKLESKCINK